MKAGAATIGLAIVLLSSCGIFTEKVKFNDSRLRPLLQAMAEVGAQRAGFSPIRETADIRIEMA